MNYLDIALGSLQETENHVDEALERKYLDAAEHAQFRLLAKRAIRAAEELKAYLRRSSSQRRVHDRRRNNPTNPTQPDRT